MENTFPGAKAKAFLFVIALPGWFALIAQFYLQINSGLAPAAELLTRFFSYFTILTNLLVAICCTALLLSSPSRPGFFKRQAVLTAVTGYIIMVGLVYNVVLRGIWEPQGLQRVVDELLHLVIPILFFVFWLICVPKNQLKWVNLFPMLIYPLVYTVVILLRGSVSGFYPYPFIDMDKLGLQQTFTNAILVALAFVAVILLIILTGKLQSRKQA